MSLPNIDQLWDYQNPVESEKRFREVLERTEADDAYAAELMTQIAHFAKAYDLLSKDPWYPPTESARLERMKELSNG